jgi:hypothetical protein
MATKTSNLLSLKIETGEHLFPKCRGADDVNHPLNRTVQGGNLISATPDIAATPNDMVELFEYEATPFTTQLRETAKNIRKRTVKCVLDNGRDFSTSKDKLERGQFRRWVETECGFSMRTAELAITVWQHVEADGNREIISLLPPTIQYLVAAQSTPQSVRESSVQLF